MNRAPDILLEWYQQQARTLPWRETKDPYAIWISEIILQQTRVIQGLDYYRRFMEAFPTVQELAAAPVEAVLKQWQGLGYYSRARNLHQAAQQVVSHYGGVLPGSSEELLKLRGVGPYTAAAVASIAFSERVVTVDGNVNRFISRLFSMAEDPLSARGRQEIVTLASAMAGQFSPGLFNQALMEFGALQCTPHPDCEICPLKNYCEAFRLDLVGELPVRKKKMKVRDRYFYYAVVSFQDQYWLRQRGAGDIWQGLYEFPLLETGSVISDFSELASALETLFSSRGSISLSSCSEVYVHALTHQRIHAVFCVIQTSETPQFIDNNATPYSFSEISELPVSRLTDRYLHSGWINP